MDLDQLRTAALRIGGHRTVAEPELVAHLLWSGCYMDADDDAREAVRRALERLDARGLPRDADGARDISEVVNLLTVDGLAGRDDFWRSREVETGRRLTRRLLGGDGAGPPGDITTLPPRRFTLTLERTFHPAEAGRDRRLRLPRPVEDGALGDLAIATEPDARLLPGRIECVRRVEAPVRLSARYAFTARGGASGADAGEPSRWLREEEGFVRVTPRVRALAAALAEGLAPADALGALRDHLLDAFACGMVHHDRIVGPATDWVLDHGWYDCLLGAALLAALCRARGIAARLVGGYLLWEAPAEHFWLEAWLPGAGWTPCDLMAWGLSAGGSDTAWRGVYADALDYRMKTQVFPDVFTGSPGGAAVAPLQRLCAAVDGGTRMRFVDARDGRPIWTDIVRVVRG